LLSQQTSTWAVIAQVPGELVLPEVRVNWFDTNSGEARVAILPEEVINVVGSASSISSVASAGGQDNGSGLTQSSNSALDQSAAQLSDDDTDALGEQVGANSDRSDPAVNAGDNTNTGALSNAVVANALRISNRWKSIAIGLLAGWVLSLFAIWLWWRSKRQGTHAVAPKTEESGIERSVKNCAAGSDLGSDGLA